MHCTVQRAALLIGRSCQARARMDSACQQCPRQASVPLIGISDALRALLRLYLVNSKLQVSALYPLCFCQGSQNNAASSTRSSYGVPKRKDGNSRADCQLVSQDCARELRIHRHAAVICCTQQMKIAVLRERQQEHTVPRAC